MNRIPRHLQNQVILHQTRATHFGKQCFHHQNLHYYYPEALTWQVGNHTFTSNIHIYIYNIKHIICDKLAVIYIYIYIYIFMVSGFLTTSQRPTAPPLGPRSAEIRGLRRVAVQVEEQRIDPAGRPQRSTLKGGDFFKQNWFRWGNN